MIERTISLTEQITDALSLAMTYNWIAGYYLLDNQPETMHTYVRKAIVLAERYHFPLWLHGTHVWSGAALVRQGEVAQGTQLMEESLAALERWGMKRSRPRMLAYLAEGYGREGKLPQAREKLDEAFALATHTGEHCWNAELHRIQGEIYALAGQEREAERHFDQAVSTAMTQHAYMFALLASIKKNACLQRYGQGVLPEDILMHIPAINKETLRKLQNIQEVMEFLDNT